MHKTPTSTVLHNPRQLLLAGAGILCALILEGCGNWTSMPAPPQTGTTTKSTPGPEHRSGTPSATPHPVRPSGERLTNQRQDVLMYTLGLLGTGYRFGGKNPEAGLDCSGMVSFIYREATNYPLMGNAASMARDGRPVTRAEVRPGDLVFFNTRGFPRSHVGIFIGEGRFVHAPATNSKIRVDRLDRGYFAQRFEEARTYFD